jgi:hypothetical protein
MRHLFGYSLALTTLMAVVGLGLAGPASAEPREIPVEGELAFCHGELVAAVDGVLYLDSSCVLNLQIVWLHPMRSVYVEFSSDGGSTWEKDPMPLVFPVVDDGLISGIGFPACDGGLLTGTYLLKAHGFKSPTEHGDLFSTAFAESVSLACG